MSTTQANAFDGPPPQQQPQTLDRGDLLDLWHVVLRRARLVMAITLTIANLAALWAFLTAPVYEATTQLLIERENPIVLT